MGQLRESRWVELNLVSSMGDACLLKCLPFGGDLKKKHTHTDGDEDTDADRSSVFARVQPDNGSCGQDTCSSCSCVTSPLSQVICDGFPVVT